jgi:hypothetical protein
MVNSLILCKKLEDVEKIHHAYIWQMEKPMKRPNAEAWLVCLSNTKKASGAAKSIVNRVKIRQEEELQDSNQPHAT